MKVGKFQIPSLDSVRDGQYWLEIAMPKGAQIIHTALQGKDAYFWALVNTEAALEKRKFYSVGTGWGTVLPNSKFISTLQMGAFVFHIFEVNNE